jgi:hypothetical protein
MYMESDGSQEDWSTEGKEDMFSAMLTALWDYCDDALEMMITPISFWIIYHMEVPTSYEPIDGPPMPKGTQVGPIMVWDYNWVGDAMQHIGRDPNWDGIFADVDYLTSHYNCSWGCHAYLVCAENDPNHNFEDGLGGYAMRYVEIHDMQMVYTRDVPVMAVAYFEDGNPEYAFQHELCHVGGALDEYEQIQCTCDEAGGYLRVENGNCETCAASPERCLMKRYEVPHMPMCPYTKGQIGWRSGHGIGASDALNSHHQRCMFIGPVKAGDIVRIFTQTGGNFVNKLRVTDKNCTGTGYILWDGANFDNQVCVPTRYQTVINDEDAVLRQLWISDPTEYIPEFYNISYVRDTLKFTLDESMA